MTAPIIPADQWPAWADRHCWDADGSGWFYGPAQAGALAWFPMMRHSDIPTPAGWDWRVPVMRSQPAPAIDLEQYGVAIQYAINGLREAGGRTDSVVARKLESLLALIDGQDKCGGELSLTDALSDYLEAQDALDYWETAGPNRDLYESVMARRNSARRDLESAMQPTKGEEE